MPSQKVVGSLGSGSPRYFQSSPAARDSKRGPSADAKSPGLKSYMKAEVCELRGALLDRFNSKKQHKTTGFYSKKTIGCWFFPAFPKICSVIWDSLSKKELENKGK